MADADTPTPADVAPAQDAAEGQQNDTEQAPGWDDLFDGEDPRKVREALDNSRKWEKRAKDNKAAADRLAELEAERMTDAERHEARIKAAEERAAELEAANDRKAVAIEHGLSAEDAALLDHMTDVDAMHAVAKRLSRQADVESRRAPYLPDSGTNPRPARDERADFVRQLVGD